MNTLIKNSLPHSIEAERSILSSILIKNDALFTCLEMRLNPRDFYVDSHQKLYETMIFLSERNSAIDLVTITAHLKNKSLHEQVGGASFLTGLFEEGFTAGHIVSYIGLTKDKAILRRIIQTASEMTSEALKSGADSQDVLDQIETKVLSIGDTKLANSSSLIRDVFLSNIQTIEDMALKKSDVVGLPTGFRDFDQLTGGLRPSQLMILAARPAMGKTSLFLSMSQNVITQEKDAVVMIFSLEMAKDELGLRLLSGSTKIPAARLKVGNLSNDEWPRLLETSSQLSNAKLHIDDTGDLSVMDIKARCRRVFAKEKRLDLVIIDYLQLMKGSKISQRGDSTREREVSEISRSLKALAKELKVPIIALSQLNRSLETRANKRPMLSDLRESGSIEADADIVAFIHREDVYNPETEDKGTAELIIAKHRAGPTGAVLLGWLPEFTLFTNLACPKVKKLPLPMQASL